VIPLSAHRASLERYLSENVFPFDSVAGRIIAERLPISYARDPVRPCLLLWACAATGGDVADALPVAVAFDLFDRFMLLHDELADVRADTIVRWGLGQSLNAGDALYALAFRSLASDVGNPVCRLAVARLVGEAVLEAIEDREGAMEGRCALTGAALQAGAIIGGAGTDVAMIFARAGRALGMASETNDRESARQFALSSIGALRPCTREADLDVFTEVALYVARQAA
jgi:geranylgeranyl diphosphate synthase type I